LALGATQARTVRSVVLPTARSGIITAVLLGIAIAMGETAPLLFTVFGNTHLNLNPFSGEQSSLTLLVYQEVKSSQQQDVNLAYTAALVLFMAVFAVFVSARVLGSDWIGRKVRREKKQARSSDRFDDVVSATVEKGALP
jgi:phosphate transport system permease protein